MGIHDGHRKRKREQFRTSGLDSFSDHEVLELLLFYALPRQDTNPIAHALMERFGTLDAVFDAPEEELVKVEGMGENAACLLHLVLPLYRRIRTTAANREKMIRSTEEAGAYFLERFAGERQEVMYQLCLDMKGRVLDCRRLAEGDVSSVNVNIRKIVQHALLCNASAVVLSHNHPSGVALPSPDDNVTTMQVQEALKTVGIVLLDHIIVADDDYVSLKHNGLIR